MSFNWEKNFSKIISFTRTKKITAHYHLIIISDYVIERTREEEEEEAK